MHADNAEPDFDDFDFDREEYVERSNNSDDVLNDDWEVVYERTIKTDKKVVLFAEPDCDTKYIITIKAGMKATIVFTEVK